MSSGPPSRDSTDDPIGDLEKAESYNRQPLLSRSTPLSHTRSPLCKMFSPCLRSPRLFLVLPLGVFGCILLLGTLFGSPDRLLSSKMPIYNSLWSSSSLNSTLGFQNIFVISLPDRYKKRDIFALMARAQGLTYDFQDGVTLNRSMSAEEKKILFPINDTEIKVNKVGSFRSHANVWQKMLVDDISTALILEDDADWDVTLKSQLQKVQTHLGQLLKETSPQNARMNKNGEWPSTGWDILRLGFCLETSYSQGQYHGLSINQVPSRIYLDDNVPDVGQCIAEQDSIMEEFKAPLYNPVSPSSKSRAQGDHSGKRLLVPSIAPICLQAYALSKEGAAKLLYYQNKVRLNLANDIGIGEATRIGFLKSYSVVPTLFAQFKSYGDSKNSDIITGDTSLSLGVETLFNGSSPCIVNSTRMSLTSIYPNAW